MRQAIPFWVIALAFAYSSPVLAQMPEPSPAPAEPVATSQPTPTPAPMPSVPEWLSRIEIGGFAVLLHRYELTRGADDANTFDLSRMYFFATTKPLDHVRFRMTLDAPNREAVTAVASDGTPSVAPNAGRLDVVLKHAYVELYDSPAKGLSFKFGMHDLPWIPYEEKIWTYRLQGPVFADREGYLSSTDLGAGASFIAPSKWIETHLSFVNGETWSKPEVSKHKDLHGRVTVRPFAAHPVLGGLSVSLAGTEGLYADGDDQTRRRILSQAAFQGKHAAVAVEGFQAEDPPSKLVSKHPSLANSTTPVVTARGGSAFGWVDLGLFGLSEGVRVIGRWESLDPDIDLARNGHTRGIVGIGYRPNNLLQILANGEYVAWEEDAGPTADERRLLLHVAVGF